MADTEKPTLDSQVVEKVSWELMETYEALATIYRSTNQLADAATVAQAARITMENSADITQSDGGAIFIPNRDGALETVIEQSMDRDLRQFGLRGAVKCGSQARYEEGPFPEHSCEGRPPRCCLWVPFSINGNWGCIFLFARGSKEYSSIDIKRVQILCCQGTLAMQSLLHLVELEERNKDLKSTLDRLTQAQGELVRAERLSALGQISSMIVHDLKNPMGGLLGYAQLLESMADSLAPEEIREYSRVIIQEMTRLSNMTEEIVEFSRGMENRLNLREMTPRDLVAAAAPVIESELSAYEISFDWDSLDGDSLLHADSDKMERVFINLAVNARKAMTAGGHFAIRTIPCESGIEFSVTDDGRGISQELRDKLFEPFQTGHGGRNLGVGLAIVRWIVESHGGKIWIENAEQQKTDIRIRLPLNKPDQAA